MANNKPKKLKKEKKGMSIETKTTLITLLKSIISNEACVEGGKNAPFWIAIIFFVVSVCLPVIPISVNQAKTYGSSFVSSANYALDRGLTNTSEKLKANGYEFVVKNGLLTFNKPVGDEFAAADIITDEKGNQEYNFLFYLSEKTGDDLKHLADSITATRYAAGTLQVSIDETIDRYCPSFIILSTETLAVGVFKKGTTEIATSTYGGLNWSNTSSEELLTRVLNVDPELTGIDKTAAVFNNWKGVFNEVYVAQRTRQTLIMSFIYLGVYAGLVLFLGLMLFLLTRGKNNAFNYLKIYAGMFIACCAAFTPAVLGMILGFIFASNIIGQMGFIVLIAIRAMWLSMRQLRPIAQ